MAYCEYQRREGRNLLILKSPIDGWYSEGVRQS
jgi:hypothetical protein